MKRAARISVHSIPFAVWLFGLLTPVSAQPLAPPAPPPGVVVLSAPPAAHSIPIGFEIRAVEVRWRHPLLRARLISGVDDEGFVRLWRKLDPGVFAIQLIEPERDGGRWRLPLGHEIAPEPEAPVQSGRGGGAPRVNPEPNPAASPGSPPADCARVGGLVPWFYTGPTAQADPDHLDPPLDGSSRANVRWLGRPGDWISRPPDLTFSGSLLVGVFDPDRASTTFLLIFNSTNRAQPAADLGEWIVRAAPSSAWVALHAVGSEARVGQGEWRLDLGAQSRGPMPGRPEYVGVVLALEEIKPGDPVDWARLGGVTMSASSSAPYHAPENVISGSVWPLPLAPKLWSAEAPLDDNDNPAWLELRLAPPRPVREIRLFFAEPAGFSPQFNPRRVEATILRPDGFDAAPMVIDEFPSGRAMLRLLGEETISGLRLTFPEPAAPEAANARPRVQAIQLRGPWSGDLPRGWEPIID